jgi:hypothetical protein
MTIWAVAQNSEPPARVRGVLREILSSYSA